jgi:small-conductance mechanosensitive channel
MWRRLAALLLACLPLGCGLWGGDDAQAPDPSPARELLQAWEAGTLTGPSTSADPRSTGTPAQDGAGGDAADAREPNGGVTGPDDSPSGAAAPVSGAQELQDRIARLEAVNDSLRATVLGLVALQARGLQGEEEADSTAEASPEAILGAGANRARNWGLRIFFSLIFLALAWLVIRLVGWALDRLAERSAQGRLFYKRLAPISRILLWVLAATFSALVILDLDASGLVAAGAAGGVALGFASQDILKNVFGGLIVLFDQPFQVGDKISVAGSYGEVVAIGLRSTRIVTPDDNLVTVPNAQVVEGQVANANAGALNCQVVTDLWLPGWVDEARAKEIAFQAATSSKFVFHNKPIVVLVKDEFDRVPLTHLKVKAYVLDPRYEFLFASDVTERARASFREAGLLPAGRTFESGVMDFYDPLSEARWGARVRFPPRADANGSTGRKDGDDEAPVEPTPSPEAAS